MEALEGLQQFVAFTVNFGQIKKVKMLAVAVVAVAVAVALLLHCCCCCCCCIAVALLLPLRRCVVAVELFIREI